MLRDPLWPKIGVTFQDGKVTGAGWAVVFWWARHREPPVNMTGVPHAHMSESQRRKFYKRRYHSVMEDAVLLEASELPWSDLSPDQ